MSDTEANGPLRAGTAMACSQRRCKPAVWLGLAGLAILFVALRWNNFNAPLVRDEGEYAYAGWLLRQGIPPYENAFVQKPPMVLYTYAAVGLLGPDLFWLPRVMAAVFVAMATVLLGLVVRSEFGPRVSWIAVWLFTPMVLLPQIQQFTANTEVFLLAPLLGTVWLSRRNESGGPVGWSLAGGLGATTLLYKYTAMPLLLTVFVVAWIHEWGRHKKATLLLRRIGFEFFGAVTAAAAILAFFVFTGSFSRLWECTVEFNRLYAGSTTFGSESMWAYVRFLWSEWWILFVLLPGLLIKRTPGIGFWAILFLAAWVATGASIYGHYYIIVMPFWAVLAALAIFRLGEWGASAFRAREWIVVQGITGAVVLLVCLSHLPWMIKSPGRFARDRLGTENPFLIAKEISRRVSDQTSTRDYVFVAGSEPQILYYAGRQSPTRFVIMYPLMIPTAAATKYQRELIRELKDRRPAFMVFVRLNMSWLQQSGSPTDVLDFLQDLLARDYQAVGGYLSEADALRWHESLPDEATDKAMVLLYKRRQAGRE